MQYELKVTCEDATAAQICKEFFVGWCSFETNDVICNASVNLKSILASYCLILVLLQAKSKGEIIAFMPIPYFKGHRKKYKFGV